MTDRPDTPTGKKRDTVNHHIRMQTGRSLMSCNSVDLLEIYFDAVDNATNQVMTGDWSIPDAVQWISGAIGDQPHY